MLVTGATGFVGSRLVAALAGRGVPVRGMSRRGGAGLIAGDVRDAASLGAALAGAGTVVHLAAATGKAPPSEHEAVNAAGTCALVRAAKAAGVQRFLFVSSIAAQFPDHRGYPYAAAKARGEACVREGGMRFLIVRPTIVAGAGSPVIAALRKLASLPVMPVFGDGRAQVQPIAVDDLVALLADVLDQDRFRGETLVAAGPDVVTIEDLMQAIRRAGGRGPAPALHLPLGVVLPLLGLAESVVYSLLPLTRGQLATFRFDGTAAGDALLGTTRLDAMLADAS